MVQLLRGIRKCHFGVAVGFDEEAIYSQCDTGSGEVRHTIGVAHGMAGIEDHGEVAMRLEVGNPTEIEGETGLGLEGADTAFAEDDLVISTGEDKFRCLEEFLEGGTESTLEQDRLAGFSAAAQDSLVVHGLGADLDDVDVFDDSIDMGSIPDFGDHFETRNNFV